MKIFLRILFPIMTMMFFIGNCAAPKQTAPTETPPTAVEEREEKPVTSEPEVNKKTDVETNYELIEFANRLEASVYYELLDTLKANIPVDFFVLRMAYTRTKDYNPYGRKSDEQKAIYNKLDEEQYDEAIKLIDEHFFSTNYVDLGSHLLASFAYTKLSDTVKAEYHYRVYEGLLTSILDSGDGKTPQSAHIVINTKEEYQLFRAFELKMNSQALTYKDGHSFDLMDVTDANANETFQIYFNIDLPLNYMNSMFKKK